ncbi:MAG: serine/threonine-protein kinase [Gemmatimonadales bacterium]
MTTPFSAERWAELGPQLDALLDAPAERRAALLTEFSRGDPDRRAELARLLAECQEPDGLLDRPAAERFAALLDELPTPFPASLASRYRLTRELGRGGMATVFLARDLRHDRDVALKVMRPELSLGRDRFLNEIAIAARLRHPHIVPLFDSGEADGVLYYVMPYEPGQSLRDRLERDGPLPLDDAMAILGDLCEALGYAHEQGVVHRDIKPDNVLLANREAMVTDFGVARAVTESTAPTPPHTDGIAIGTPAYMAPEQIGADGSSDQRVDIYALGVVGYELLAGRPPFTGDLPRVLAGHLTESPPALSSHRGDLPSGLEAVIMKCLAKRPADRWPDADAVRNALHGAWDPGAIGRGARWRPARRHWIGGALIAIAVTAATIARSRANRVPADDREPAPVGIGILPVTAASPGGGLDWLAAGLATQLSRELTEVPGLAIRPNETIAASLDLPLDSVALRSDVDYFVRLGVSRGQADSADLTVELIENGIRSVRAGSLTVTLSPPNSVQLVGRSVAELLRPMLGARVRERQLEAGTTNRLALRESRRADQYRLLGRQRIVAGDLPGAARAIDSAAVLLLAAERLDRGWTAPRLARASIGIDRILFRIGPGAPDYPAIQRDLDAGIAIVDSVLDAKPRSALALATRGRLRWLRIGLGEPWPHLAVAATDSAQADLEAALAADSTMARAAADLSQLLFEQRGRYREAAKYAERGYRLDAYLEDASEIINRLAQSNLEIGEDAVAARWCAEGLRRFPANPAHLACALEVLAWGRGPANADSAWHYFAALERRMGTWNASARAIYRIAVAAVLARAPGVPADSARAVLARAHRDVGGDPATFGALSDDFVPFEAAVLYRLGDSTRASALFARLQQIDSVTAERMAGRRMLRDFLGRGRDPAP